MGLENEVPEKWEGGWRYDEGFVEVVGDAGRAQDGAEDVGGVEEVSDFGFELAADAEEREGAEIDGFDLGEIVSVRCSH